jgi:glycosyltransferase involved in cell wall biosynthesis
MNGSKTILEMHMNWPSLSIIIPSFNQGKFIERTILSILKQKYPGTLEVIVSDGGSKDETVDILKKYPQLIWWSQPDKGFVDAVNKGFAMAKGDILAIQSSDDFYLKGAFKRCIKELINNKEISVISGCDIYIEPDRKTFTVSDLNSHYVTPRTLLIDRVIPQHCAFFRRNILQKIGGLRTEVDTCSDIDLWYRALHHFKGRFTPHYVGAYQFHDNQRTKTLKTWFLSQKKMVEMCETDDLYNPKFRLTDEDKKNIYKIWELKHDLNHGDREKVLDEIDLILRQKVYSEKTKRELRIMIGVNEPRAQKYLRVINEFSLSYLFKKINLHIQKYTIDIDWWQK